MGGVEPGNLHLYVVENPSGGHPRLSESVKQDTVALFATGDIENPHGADGIQLHWVEGTRIEAEVVREPYGTHFSAPPYYGDDYLIGGECV